ncbi:MAG: hypothetical protein SGJ27_30290 [Candidatus Melainabacteria bacterium]|nr:hypothetical protein [Candidatus Melainabacteria bacterium]
MLNARNLEVLQPQLSDVLEVENTDTCDQIECPALLNQLWERQIRKQQIASDRAYAKKHSLELAFSPKLLTSKLADRSNKYNQVA